MGSRRTQRPLSGRPGLRTSSKQGFKRHKNEADVTARHRFQKKVAGMDVAWARHTGWTPFHEAIKAAPEWRRRDESDCRENAGLQALPNLVPPSRTP